MAARQSLRGVIVAGLCSAWTVPCALAQEIDRPKYLGSQSCASASCHGGDALFSAGGRRRDEYSRWLESDPHARSARTLAGEPFRRILALVSSGRVDGPPDGAVAQRCAACHDPHSVSATRGGVPGGYSRGIGCEACHGPAERWLAVHYRDDLSRESLRGLGMVDTKDLVVRAELCAGCHVGGGNQDMNHDMIAAGHPPLRFELSAYHDLIERKHWTDAERIQTPHFKARLWAAGQLATADAALALLESRAKRAAEGDKDTPWPEFSEYDCFACHQRLRPVPSSSVALRGTASGIPGWQPWNLALAERLLGDESADQPILQIRGHMQTSPFSDAEQARRLVAVARGQVERHPLKALLAGGASESYTALDLLKAANAGSARPASWVESCQQLLALKATYLATRDEARKLDGELRLVSGSELLQEDHRAMAARLEAIGRSLGFPAREFDWPAYDWSGLPEAARGQPPPLTDVRAIADELKSIADELQRRAAAASPESL